MHSWWNDPEDYPSVEEEELIQGKKYDKGKLRHDLIPPLWHNALAEVLTHGAEKYGDDNWLGVASPESRYYAALMRHLQAYREGEIIDQESGMSHLRHAFTNLGFLVTAEERENE